MPPELIRVSWTTWSPRVPSGGSSFRLCTPSFSAAAHALPSPSLSPWHHSSCSPISIISSFQECCINGVMQYAAFFYRLLSLNAILLRSGQVMFFFISEPCFMVWMQHHSGFLFLFLCFGFSHSLFERHLDCHQVPVIVNTIALNLHVQIFV